MINKKLLLLFIGLIITTQMIYSQVPSYVPTNGLVGYWPFNGNANDVSSNGNNGTVNGATLTTDRFGNNNSAYNFDGVNDYIQTNYSGILGTANRSVSFWAKHTESFNSSQCASCSRRPIISYGSNVQGPSQIGQGFYCEFNVGLTGINFDGNETTASYSTNSPVNDGQWHQYVYVFNNVSNVSSVKIYQDGILLNNLSYTYLPSFNLNTILGADMAFGRRTFNQNAPYYYKGDLDDIGIWNRALSQQEITNMYNGVNYSDTCNAVSGSLVNGLVGYWPFCGNANDQSGNGNNGVVNGASLTTDRFGNTYSAYSFDGVNNYISTNYSGILGTTDRSVSFWAKQSQIFNNSLCASCSRKTIISYGSNIMGPSQIGNGFYCEFNVGLTGISFDGNETTASYSTPFPVNDNNWHHYVFVMSSVTNASSVKIYQDGILLNQLSYTYLPSAIINTLLGNNLEFGRRTFNQQNPTYYNGQLDDIGMWNRALSQQEIIQLFNQNLCVNNITVTDTLIINVGQLSYTNPVTYANNITIFPNPANTQVNISFNNITDLTGGNINIINSLGQQVATTPITLSGTNTTMPLNTWGGTGLYFVQILNAQGQIVDIKKIILQ
jgi:hypothetical protein